MTQRTRPLPIGLATTHTRLHKTQLLSLSGENVYLTLEKGVFSVVTEKIANSVKKKKKKCAHGDVKTKIQQTDFFFLRIYFSFCLLTI